MASICLTLRNCQTIFQCTFQPVTYESFNGSISSVTFNSVSLFHFNFSKRVYSSIIMILSISPLISDADHFSMCLLFLYFLLWNVFSSLLSIFNCIVFFLICRNSVYILHSSLLSDVCFVKIVSQFCGYSMYFLVSVFFFSCRCLLKNMFLILIKCNLNFLF